MPVAVGFILVTGTGAAAAPQPEATIDDPIAPFEQCPNRGYMITLPFDAGNSTLNSYDISTATLNPIATLPGTYNAAGFSTTQRVFWAVKAVSNPPEPGEGPFPDELARIDSLGNVDNIGAPENLADMGFDDFLALSGTVFGDTMYVHTKVPANRLFEIDVAPGSATLGHIVRDVELSRMSPGNPDSMLNIGDWDYNYADGWLYSIELSGGHRTVVKINPTDGEVVDLADVSDSVPDSSNYGAIFMEKGSQTLYASANNVKEGGSEIGQSQTFEIRLDFDPPIVTSFGRGPALRVNDGMDCLLATDFGDAPDSYQTSDAANGPAHVLSSVFDGGHKLAIGSEVDSDLDGFPTAAADYDDGNLPVGDEDGVAPHTYLVRNGASLTVKITNTTGREATLAGWVDFDGSGTFDQGERAVAKVPAGATTATLNWPVTESAAAPELARMATGREEAAHASFLRLRLFAGNVGDPRPTGWVDGGEVEDHRIHLGLALPVSGAKIQPMLVLGGGLVGFGGFILAVAWILGRRSPND